MRYVWDILKNEPNFASFWTKLSQKIEMFEQKLKIVCFLA